MYELDRCRVCVWAYACEGDWLLLGEPCILGARSASNVLVLLPVTAPSVALRPMHAGVANYHEDADGWRRREGWQSEQSRPAYGVNLRKQAGRGGGAPVVLLARRRQSRWAAGVRGWRWYSDAATAMAMAMQEGKEGRRWKGMGAGAGDGRSASQQTLVVG